MTSALRDEDTTGPYGFKVQTYFAPNYTDAGNMRQVISKFWNWMDKIMRIAAAQYNPKIGDLEGNTSKTIDFIVKAREQKCDLVVFRNSA